jgi:glycosyltransferase involved in cell wall biosynthesis
MHLPSDRKAPVLVSLPDGFSVSGITLWALRLAGVLAARGHSVALLAHEEPTGQAGLALDLPPGVAALRLTGLPPLRAAAGDLAPFIPPYRDEARRLARRAGAPVVFLPTTLGDSFGIAAALTLVDPELVRVVGFQHADTPYDTRLLVYYEPVLASLVGVSRRVAESIAAALAHRRADVAHLPNAVPIGHAPPERAPVRNRPLRLVYTGRIEQKQKRVGVLVRMSDVLAERAVPHTLTLIGDGPALPELRALAAEPARAGRLIVPGALAPAGVRAVLRDSDCFVLASRYEGLSVAMIEAMSEGCVPIVTGAASGADEAIVDGLSGILVHTGPDESDHAVASAMAHAVERAAGDLRRLSPESWRRVRDAFSLGSYAPRAAAVIDAAAAAPPRAWPAHLSVAFSSSTNAGSASGSVPADAARRLAEALRSLAGRDIILHGAGRHTIELAAVLAASPARIVAIADDDPGRWGRSLLGWPITSPDRAAALGAGDVVISSWLHADDVYSRRGVYERQGLRVHHLYRDAHAGQPDSYNAPACTN